MTNLTFKTDAVCSPDVFRWTSHSPERRAVSETAGLQEAISHFCQIANDLNAKDDTVKITQEHMDRLCERYVKLVRNHWSALSRCASPMITGPARFPTERNRKANDSEHKRMGEVLDFYNGFGDRLRRIAYPRVSKTQVAPELATVKEHVFGAIKVLENEEVDRLQLIFPAKPEPETVALLKSRGFKWSPRFGAWQRQLTNNARAAVNTLMPQIVKLEAA